MCILSGRRHKVTHSKKENVYEKKKSGDSSNVDVEYDCWLCRKHTSCSGAGSPGTSGRNVYGRDFGDWDYGTEDYIGRDYNSGKRGTASDKSGPDGYGNGTGKHQYGKSQIHCHERCRSSWRSTFPFFCKAGLGRWQTGL